MKSLLLLLVVLAAAVTAQTTDYPRERCSDEVAAQCPIPDPPNAVHFPDPENCASFCECDSGIAFRLYCQTGLLYDAEHLVCNWANQVDCGDRPIPE